jgi:hypothetical protein
LRGACDTGVEFGQVARTIRHFARIIDLAGTHRPRRRKALPFQALSSAKKRRRARLPALRFSDIPALCAFVAPCQPGASTAISRPTVHESPSDFARVVRTLPAYPIKPCARRYRRCVDFLVSGRGLSCASRSSLLWRTTIRCSSYPCAAVSAAEGLAAAHRGA